MKKVLTLFLVLVLVTALVCTPAFAEREGVDDPTNNTNVNVDVTLNVSVEHKYFVDIEYPTDMTFTYTEESIHTWNASDHSYRTSTWGSWDKSKATITVTNHSNVDVKVKITFTPVEGTGITGVLKKGSARLKAGAVGEYSNADSMTATLTLRGKPTEAVTSEGVKVGSILVTIQ